MPISNRGGGGIITIAEKADGSQAVFADKAALDSYTTLHPAWANSLTSSKSVILGTEDAREDFAYVRKAGEWVPITVNFKGLPGEKGETVKITGVAIERIGKDLSVTVSLDDGTSATSNAEDIAFVASVNGNDPSDSGDITLTAGDLDAYTKSETDAEVSSSASTINDRIDTEVGQINEAIDELVETLVENAPFKLYTALSQIDVTLEDLDGINNDQIRIRNFLALVTAMGVGTEAVFSESADERISPVNYSRLYVNAQDLGRASATAITKKTSDIYVISASVNDGEDCVGWVRLVNETNLKSNANINQITSENDLTIKSADTSTLIVGAGSIDVRNKRIINVDDAVEDQDATTLTQTNKLIDESFLRAVQASVNKPDYEVDIRDQDRSTGYGKNGTIISYFAPNVGNISPDLNYGKWFFIHDKVNSTTGWHMIHKSLLPESIQDREFSFFQLSGISKGSLGKANQNAANFADDSIWDSNGRLIPNSEDANDQTHDEYFDKDGNIVTTFESSLAGAYSFGSMAIIGPSLIYKGNVVFESDDVDPYFVLDPSSDWHVFYGKIGGGTFNVRKVFQAFPRDYDALSYVVETAAEALGIKVSANAEAISELQDEFQVIETDYVQKSDLEDAIEDVADDIIDTELQNRMRSTKIDYDDSIDTIIPVATATLDSIQVLYRINSVDGGYREAGRLEIYRTDDSHTYAVDAITRPIGPVPTEFSAYLDTGSIVLKLHNTGSGNGASITYRNNLFGELRTTA